MSTAAICTWVWVCPKCGAEATSGVPEWQVQSDGTVTHQHPGFGSDPTWPVVAVQVPGRPNVPGKDVRVAHVLPGLWCPSCGAALARVDAPVIEVPDLRPGRHGMVAERRYIVDCANPYCWWGGSLPVEAEPEVAA